MPTNSQSSSEQQKDYLPDATGSLSQTNPLDVLTLIRQANLQLGTKLSLKELSTELLNFVHPLLDCDYVLLFVRDVDEINFKFQQSHPTLDSPIQAKLKRIFFNSYNAQDDAIIGQWLQNNPIDISENSATESQVLPILDTLEVKSLYSIPLMTDNTLYGVLLCKLETESSLSQNTLNTFMELSPHLGIYLG